MYYFFRSLEIRYNEVLLYLVFAKHAPMHIRQQLETSLLRQSPPLPMRCPPSGQSSPKKSCSAMSSASGICSHDTAALKCRYCVRWGVKLYSLTVSMVWKTGCPAILNLHLATVSYSLLELAVDDVVPVCTLDCLIAYLVPIKLPWLSLCIQLQSMLSFVLSLCCKLTSVAEINYGDEYASVVFLFMFSVYQINQ